MARLVAQCTSTWGATRRYVRCIRLCEGGQRNVVQERAVQLNDSAGVGPCASESERVLPEEAGGDAGCSRVRSGGRVF